MLDLSTGRSISSPEHLSHTETCKYIFSDRFWDAENESVTSICRK